MCMLWGAHEKKVGNHCTKLWEQSWRRVLDRGALKLSGWLVAYFQSWKYRVCKSHMERSPRPGVTSMSLARFSLGVYYCASLWAIEFLSRYLMQSFLYRSTAWLNWVPICVFIKTEYEWRINRDCRNWSLIQSRSETAQLLSSCIRFVYTTMLAGKNSQEQIWNEWRQHKFQGNFLHLFRVKCCVLQGWNVYPTLLFCAETD